MKYPLLFPVVLSLGCSVLFDPGKAPPRACPGSAAACPALPNATASCEAEACQYSCGDGFVDGNADLGAAASDGCELSCAAGALPQNPAALVATVGAAPGEVAWTFPISPVPVARYKLCTQTPGGLESCLTVAPATECPLGTCAVTTTGHLDNVRVTGRAVSVDVCGREGAPATAPTVGATPLDTTDVSKWVHETSCPTGTAGVVGGQLSLENTTATCVATLVAGDELWGDFTLDADVRHSTPGTDTIAGGLAFHVNGTGHRLVAVVATETSNFEALLYLAQRLPAGDKTLATSIHGAKAGAPSHLRVVSRQGDLSVALGPTAATAAERIRYPEVQRRTGKVGIAAIGLGRVEMTNLRVTTASALPARGSAAVSLDFSGGALPADTRERVPANVSVGPCPNYPPAPLCDGGCLPAAGAQCLRVRRVLFVPASVSFDLPPGIDVREPWSMSLRFASAPDAGGSFPGVVKSQQGNLLAADFTWGGTARVLGTPAGRPVAPGEWHNFSLSFGVDGGLSSAVLDDVVVPAARDLDWSPHLGVFTLGDGTGVDVQYTDVRVSQP